MPAGDTVTFTLNAPAGETIAPTERWQWATDSGGAAQTVSGCQVEFTCRMKMNGRGHPFMNGIQYHGFNVSAVGPTIGIAATPTQIKIDTVYGPLSGGSFTARPGENTVTLKATVTPESLAARISWTVTVDPSSFNGTRLPPSGLTGATTTFQVQQPANPRTRWPGTHPGALTTKQFGYQVQASVVSEGQTYRSDMRTLVQAERDVLREEYLEFSDAPSPGVNDLGQETTLHFSSGELNSGDYTLWWVQAVFRTGIEAVRSLAAADFAARGLPFHGITMTSGFRNPVHHRIHNGATNRSYHEFGLAADFRITDQPFTAEQFFNRMRKYAHDDTVGACFEPKQSIIKGSPSGTLDHAHLDWGACDPGWGP